MHRNKMKFEKNKKKQQNDGHKIKVAKKRQSLDRTKKKKQKEMRSKPHKECYLVTFLKLTRSLSKTRLTKAVYGIDAFKIFSSIDIVNFFVWTNIGEEMKRKTKVI